MLPIPSAAHGSARWKPALLYIPVKPGTDQTTQKLKRQNIIRPISHLTAIIIAYNFFNVNVFHPSKNIFDVFNNQMLRFLCKISPVFAFIFYFFYFVLLSSFCYMFSFYNR